ncbi:MAG: glycosyl transferase family 2 [Acidocella sp. 20-57-95]|nr:MAG: glycosyl transferase family 2 [Acidocella sp. 20-57-95]HQT63896.1 glycosyltransferase family 2 protein [Acidocella sp.]
MTRVAVPLERQVRGFIDKVDEASVEGWAFDGNAPGERLKLRVLIDGLVVDVITCDRPRDDVAKLNLPDHLVGFFYTIPLAYQDGMRHVLRFATVEGVAVTLASRGGMAMPELHFCLVKQTYFEGCLDGLVDGLIQGWALNIDRRGKFKSGGVKILVCAGGLPVAELVADQFRADVAESLQSDGACGFSFSPPSELRSGRRLVLSFYAMPGRHELRNSPVEIAFPGDTERQRIQGLIARADELFTYAYHLRRELLAALPGERYMLGDYAFWAKKSLPLAAKRAARRYGKMPDELPLISVVCPVFKPDIGEFLTAVDSVVAQGYQNWELILVDDGSKDALLSDTMARLVKHDARIKSFTLRENAGISVATNKALKAAAGQFIAFFDHDDVLEPDALEIMVRAQHATGAKLLYSDEDKIDRTGGLSEPHFKPDFNYRFLLEVNYICHLVMVEAATFKKIGVLNSLFDGAQDHDFLLRASEILEPAQIHHVAEVLYHWRKSATSSAAWGAAKPNAGYAGQMAVTAHLNRRGLNAHVKKRGDLTCYQVNWEPAVELRKAVGVSILIPFRDQIEMTRACVEAIRKYTKDVNYEIILIDNWSSGAAAEAFCVEQANMPRTQVVRVAQPFNFSLLNNIGAKQARHEYLLFLNNDVFVKNPDWLNVLLNECLMNDEVAAVGAKLLYPNGTIQHAGVVLGVGGVADHAFRGQPGNTPGYVMRAMAAQQISAVTGACMLVRKVAFEEVGGFDEAELAVAFNDVDLCVKLTQAGWKIIYAADCVVEHHESMSRGSDLTEGKVSRFMLENKVMEQRYTELLPYDPFYNQHFSREGGVYRELRLLEP